MSLFDGKIKTGTRIDLEGDDFSPNMGALVGSSYKEDVLNHGTLNQVVQGNVTRLFCVNETITVSANQTLTVGANRSATIGANDSLTVGANLTETVGAMVTQTYGGGQMTTCAGPHMRTDISARIYLCSGGTFINGGPKYEFKAFKGGVYPVSQMNYGLSANLAAVKVDVVIAKNVSSAITTKCQGVVNKMVAGIRNRVAATALCAQLHFSHISGTQLEARLARPAVGIELNVPADTVPGAQ